MDIARPKIEGSIAVGENKRRIGFAEFGSASGRAVVWLHGTPGARRQIPTEAREYAALNGIRLIGLDRPGVGSSTPHRYANVAGFASDLTSVLDALGVDEFAVIGLSGGGPYALAAAHAMPERVVAAGILGGVAPTVGPDAIGGGAMRLGSLLAPAVQVAGAPIGRVLSAFVGVARPIAEPAIRVYGRLSPQADRELLGRPSSAPCSSTTSCSVAAAGWTHRSPTSWCSRRIGDSASPSECAGPVVARRSRPHHPLQPRRSHGGAAARRQAVLTPRRQSSQHLEHGHRHLEELLAIWDQPRSDPLSGPRRVIRARRAATSPR
ncbi:Proline iminopeptidase [Gordonia bronchialis]|nr:Proline iminopeptidase [Gordonia bronchialis]